MRKTLFLRYLMGFLLLLMANTAIAQSTGDKLFLEGQQLQKTMTVKSQNAAIKKFQAAKVVYTAAEKKQMCDNQISTCHRNIKTIKAQSASDKKEEEKEADRKEIVEEEPKVEVVLEVSPGKIEYKGDPKGKSQTITVKSNYTWKVEEKPEWVEVFMGEGKFNVTATLNDTDDRRFGDIVVVSGNKKAIIKVYQKDLNLIQKGKKAITGK